MLRKIKLGGWGFVFLIGLMGCGNNTVNNSSISPSPQGTEKSKETPANKPSVGMANPASKNCINKGGKLEIRENEKGQYGVCIFEDNRQCEEWSLMRGICPEGGLKVTGYENEEQIYCVITGGQVEGVGTKEPKCKRADGVVCGVKENFNGKCPVVD